jgi:hypothetical protein
VEAVQVRTAVVWVMLEAARLVGVEGAVTSPGVASVETTRAVEKSERLSAASRALIVIE